MENETRWRRRSLDFLQERVELAPSCHGPPKSGVFAPQSRVAKLEQGRGGAAGDFAVLTKGEMGLWLR